MACLSAERCLDPRFSSLTLPLIPPGTIPADNASPDNTTLTLLLHLSVSSSSLIFPYFLHFCTDFDILINVDITLSWKSAVDRWPSTDGGNMQARWLSTGPAERRTGQRPQLLDGDCRQLSQRKDNAYRRSFQEFFPETKLIATWCIL